jgi:hypothetical protein
LTLETLTLEAGERGEIVLCPEQDTRDPQVTLEGSGDFAVEEVMLGNLPAPSVAVANGRRGTWSASVHGVVACPDRPLKVLVRNVGEGKITLRATITEEDD